MLIVTAKFGYGNLGAIVQQASDSGVAGPLWNNVSQAWETAPALADCVIPLYPSGIPGGLIGGVAEPMGTYTGTVIQYIVDLDNNYQMVGPAEVYMVSGRTYRDLILKDITDLPATLQAYLTTNPIPFSGNLDTSGLATTTQLNAARDAILTDLATIEYKEDVLIADTTQLKSSSNSLATLAASIDGKLPADTVTKLGRLDATISSRSTVTAADVRTELAANPVPASNMVDISGLATSAGLASTLSTISSQLYSIDGVVDAVLQDTAALDTRITAARAGYLDNLSGGPVALAAQVTTPGSIRSKMIAPAAAIIPPSAATSIRIEILLYDTDGALNDPDGGVVTFTATNQTGASRQGNLTSVTKAAVGRYYVDYAIAPTHGQEQIVFRADWTEGNVDLTDAAIVSVDLQATTAFTSTDRTKLEAIHAKLPTSSYLVGTANSSGVIDASTISGDKSAFKADISGLATTVALAALQTHGDTNWATATGFLQSTDTRLNNLDATISSRSTFNTGSALATAAQITALQTHGDATWATATGFLQANDARLNNLDAAISSRSTFAGTNVTLATGHGLALETTAQAIKAKTDNLPAAPAAVSNIPTAAAVAAQVETTLVASHGSGAWTTGTATLGNQTAILSAIAAIDGVTTISAKTINDKRTWFIPANRETSLAPNEIVVNVGETITLAMDFSELLNEGTSLSTVSAVTGITATNLSVDQTRTNAHLTINPVEADAGTKRIKVTATTTDGQTLTASGYLTVASST